MSRKLDFKNYYIASIQHLPDGDRRNYVIQLTWEGFGDFSYKILNAEGDHHDINYYYSEDYYFHVLQKLEDTGVMLDVPIYKDRYYYVRVQHKPDKKLHTAIVKILECYKNGNPSITADVDDDFMYQVSSYPFSNHFYKSKDCRFEFIKYLNMI